MIAVIFEVLPHAAFRLNYLEAAAKLAPHLEAIPGFISIERFSSLSDSDRILSLSFWKDEASVAQWHNFEMHREMQQKGREQFFQEYRISIASVIRNYDFRATSS